MLNIFQHTLILFHVCANCTRRLKLMQRIPKLPTLEEISYFLNSLESVGGAAVFLASDYGAHTTGEINRVDGGFHVLGMMQSENL